MATPFDFTPDPRQGLRSPLGTAPGTPGWLGRLGDHRRAQVVLQHEVDVAVVLVDRGGDGRGDAIGQ
jgi:hypothetical protein